MGDVKGLNELESFCRELAEKLPPAAIVLLNGPLGSGKTYLVSNLLRGLGCNEAASPTFAIHHEYKVGERVLHHFDLYRLQNEEEIETSGLWDILRDIQTAKNGWVFIEWAKRLGEFNWPISMSVYAIDIGISGDRRSYSFRKI